MLLPDRVVLITGSSKGLGCALAHTYADAGARVIINARGAAALEATRSELMAKHASVLALPADATQSGDIARLVDLALTHFGCIDVLINNAGILGPSPRPNMDEFAAV